ncbi:MAG: cell wall biogenesis protein [Legionellaceae bacterium]|nr:cell wall biogenesis protein [Legionellaceae bacterium]
MRQVPFFNYKVFAEQYEQAILDITKDILHRGAFIMQSDMCEFEKQIASYIGVKHAISVANCTDGLVLALKAVGIGPSDEVIVPSHTFVATAASVKLVGAEPMLVDCGRDHMIDPDAIEAAITEKTAAIMPVQLNGRTCEMDKILDIAKKHGLKIVEDAAQALGSQFNGKFAGTFGDAAAFSFYPAKILGCLGDGGIVVTNDDEVARQVFMLRDHGRDEDGEIKVWSGNSRLDNLQAAILNHIFKDYDKIIARRREIAGLYQEKLKDLKQLLLPPSPEDGGAHFDVYQNYEIEAEERDELQVYLREKGVGTLVQWNGKAVHQHSHLKLKHSSLPYTEEMTKKYIMLPMNMTETNEDVEYVCQCIHEFYEEHA